MLEPLAGEPSGRLPRPRTPLIGQKQQTAGARQRERAYDRLVNILLADPDRLSRSGSLTV
jgi:hypothetical protein